MELVVGFILDLLLSSLFLWVGMKFTSMLAGIPLSSAYCSVTSVLKVCFLSSLCFFIPVVGVALSWITLFYFLKSETEAEFWELIVMVLVAKLSAFLTLILFIPLWE